MTPGRSHGTDKHGLKRSSGVDYSQVRDRQIDDHRFERQRVIRAASSAPPVEQQPKNAGVKAAAPVSATMDAFMRMVTGKEERTIADRISDPNRPTWEQYKKENADKLDLTGRYQGEETGGKQQLQEEEKKHKKRSGSSSSDDLSNEDEHRRSKHKSRKKRKSRKRRRKSLDLDDSDPDLSDDRSRRHKRSQKSKKSSSRKDRDVSPSPVRLSSFLQQSSDGSDDE
ncbi:unnamed protein product [Peronospora destructor]|uniref:Uncharacterized protein n=1 Tax=Peronospora destructor TaxID=86335 RepID=A0AAV0VFX6_9STRA|nr:unnamed protein product [Peronospora destructor]